MTDTQVRGRRQQVPAAPLEPKPDLSAPAMLNRLAGLFTQASKLPQTDRRYRPMPSRQQLLKLIYMAKGIELTFADSTADEDIERMLDIFESTVRRVKACCISGKIEHLPTAKQTAAFGFLERPLSERQQRFYTTHSEWAATVGCTAMPSLVAGHQRLYQLHANAFGVGDNNSCGICQANFEADRIAAEVFNTELDDLAAAFDKANDGF